MLGGLGQLFKNPNRLYVYPHVNIETGEVTTAENFPIASNLRHLYTHVMENRFIRSIRNFNPDLLRIRSRDVVAKILAGDPSWEPMVPPKIVDIIKRGKLMGYDEKRQMAE